VRSKKSEAGVGAVFRKAVEGGRLLRAGGGGFHGWNRRGGKWAGRKS